MHLGCLRQAGLDTCFCCRALRVDFLLKMGAEKDVKDNDVHGLDGCLYSRALRCADLLLKAGADKDAKVNHGRTALMYGLDVRLWLRTSSVC